MSGYLVVLEGIEACGKTTQVGLLSKELAALGYDVVCLREPGGTFVGEQVRSIFLSAFHGLVPEVEVALLLAAKSQLLHEKILPALLENKLVICDRGTATLLAYQHGGRGIELDLIAKMLAAMNCDLPLDVTFYLDITVEESIRRLSLRKEAGGEISTIDKMKTDFHHRVRSQFDEMFKIRPDQYPQFKGVVIDAHEPEQDITNQMIQTIVDQFPLRRPIVPMRD